MPGTTINRSTAGNSQQDSANSLFQRNYCRWPSCDTLCSSLADFNRHLTDEHALDDRSVAQARVQQHVVQQLEALLTREREILQAMMRHLHGGSTNTNGATSSNANSLGTHLVTQPNARTLTASTPYHHTLTGNARAGQLASLSSPASSSSSINNTSSSTNALHHLPIVKLENAFLTSAGVITAGDAYNTTIPQDLSSAAGVTSSGLLRASASSSPPPVHTVEEEVGDDTQDDDEDDDDDDDDQMDDTHGDLSAQGGPNGSILPVVSMGKHRMRRKTKAMLALGGKKAGKGKGQLHTPFSGLGSSRLVCLELKNREYYMTHDVRPPFTYATLIRQVSCERQSHDVMRDRLGNH